MPVTKRPRERQRFLVLYNAAVAFGANLVAGLLIGYYAGGYLDRRLGTEPWIGLLIMSLAVIAAFIGLIRRLQATMTQPGEQGGGEPGERM